MSYNERILASQADSARRGPAGHTGRATLGRVDKSDSDICVSPARHNRVHRGLRGRGEAGTMQMRR